MGALTSIQKELKAPKSNFNSFGKYNYRSCEDILEAVKPLLDKYKSTLFLSDEVVEVGGRIYVKATATFRDGSSEVKVTAYARESVEKKGMDDSQITGTASSYARKYALNGLFLIDDTKDADTDEFAKQTKPEKPKETKPKTGTMTPLQKVKLQNLMTEEEWDNAIKKNGDYKNWTNEQAEQWISALERRNNAQ